MRFRILPAVIMVAGIFLLVCSFYERDNPVKDMQDLVLISPSDLQATALGSDRIRLTWQDNSDNEDGFYLECGTTSEVYDSIYLLPPNTTSYTDTNLQSNTIYYYVVKIHIGDTLYSDFTPEVACTTSNDST